MSDIKGVKIEKRSISHRRIEGKKPEWRGRVVSEKTQEYQRYADNVRSTLKKNLEEFKDNRGFFDKLGSAARRMFGGNEQEIKDNKEKYDSLVSNLTEYGVNFNFPKAIKEKLKNGEYLTENEFQLLNTALVNVTRLAPIKKAFTDQLKERNVSKIEGDITKEFPKDTPIDVHFLSALKRDLIKGGFPDMVTANPDPRKFEFFLGEFEPEVLEVKNREDLFKLKERLEECSKEALKSKPSETGKAARGEPIDITKNGIITKTLNQLLDTRSFWGRIFGDSANEAQVKLNYGALKGELAKQGVLLENIKNPAIEKLEKSEPLSEAELSRFTSWIYFEINKAKFKTDSGKEIQFIEQNLIDLFNYGEFQQIGRTGFEQFLHGLKQDMIKRGYPDRMTYPAKPYEFGVPNDIGDGFELFAVKEPRDLDTLQRKLDVFKKFIESREKKTAEVIESKMEPIEEERVVEKKAKELLIAPTKEKKPLPSVPVKPSIVSTGELPLPPIGKSLGEGEPIEFPKELPKFGFPEEEQPVSEVVEEKKEEKPAMKRGTPPPAPKKKEVVGAESKKPVEQKVPEKTAGGNLMSQIQEGIKLKSATERPIPAKVASEGEEVLSKVLAKEIESRRSALTTGKEKEEKTALSDYSGKYKTNVDAIDEKISNTFLDEEYKEALIKLTQNLIKENVTNDNLTQFSQQLTELENKKDDEGDAAIDKTIINLIRTLLDQVRTDQSQSI